MTHRDVDEANVFPNCLIKLPKHAPVEVVRWRFAGCGAQSFDFNARRRDALGFEGFLDFFFPKALGVLIWNDVRF